jgi:hypothetical protein
MKPRVSLAAFCIATLACGRHDPPPDIVERAGGVERLREGALSVRDLAPQTDGEVVIPKDRWPEAFRRLEPEIVTADRFGVEVTLTVDTLYSSGLYLPFDSERTPKELGHDLSYRPVAPGVYWYRMTMGG